MSGISILRRLLLKEAVKGSGQASGIMSIGDSVRKLADKRLQSYLLSAQKQGVDLDKLGEQEIRYMLEMNKPKAPKVISQGDPEFQGITEALLGKRGKVIEGKFGKPFKEEIGSVDNIVNDITRMEPIAAMKEVNKVLGKKGKYKNLSKQDSEKIFNNTDDWVNQRDPADLYDYKNKKPFREDPNFDPDDPDFNPEDMADGGVAGMLGERTGFKDGKGPKMSRRNFIKIMGGLAALPIVGKFFKFAKPLAKTSKAAEVITTPAAAGKPAWFDSLVTRVIREGDDVTKKFATKEREIVHLKKIDDDATVTVYRDLDNGTVRVDVDDATKNVMDEQGDSIVSMEVRGGQIEQGVKGKTPAEFEAVETDYRNYAAGPDDFVTEGIDNTVSNIKNLTADLTKVKMYAKGQKKPTIKEMMIQRRREGALKQAEERPAEYAADRGPDEIDYSDFDYASGGIARMLGE